MVNVRVCACAVVQDGVFVLQQMIIRVAADSDHERLCLRALNKHCVCVRVLCGSAQ